VVPAAVLLGAVAMGLTEPSGGAEFPEGSAELLDRVNEAGAPEGLLVLLTRQGTTVVWNDGGDQAELHDHAHLVPCPDFSCDDADDWDNAGFVDALRAIKRLHPDADTLTLVPAEDVPFRAVTDALSAARFDGAEPLFPYAVISRR